MAITVPATLDMVAAFAPGNDDLAHKSKELILAMLRHTESPFSRKQFKPGHITCTAIVVSPDLRRVLLMYHHRHSRWLLPGGHVETEDITLAETARREAEEETGAQMLPAMSAFLAGMDVHGIPEKKREPFHLHHDLIFALQAKSERFGVTKEAPRIVWAAPADFGRYDVPPSIRRSVGRAMERFVRGWQADLHWG